MLKIGTLCYVVDTCLAAPLTQRAVGRIVEIASAPYEAPSERYLPGTYYDVAFEGWTFYCRSDKLRPIHDPDAWIERWQDADTDAGIEAGPVTDVVDPRTS
ncbi:MAG: hypothetical protein ABW220_03775 [Burkholderiaceae bacterium]